MEAFNGTPIPTETNSTYTIASLASTDAGLCCVVFKQEGGTPTPG
jgi:hypothetical protein